MGKYFCSETDILSAWDQVLRAFWLRYPNPFSAHVLTEDVVFRELTADRRLLSRRLLTKTNRLPRWAEKVFPAHLSRCVYILEDSVVDPHTRQMTTTSWNLNHNTLMTIVERCVFQQEAEKTHLRREAWISSGVYGLSRPIQEFGLARFKSNQMKAVKGLEHALSKLQKMPPCLLGDQESDKPKSLPPSAASTTQKPQQFA
ncbi:PRELI domain containing 1b [Hypomesus transpacificus]|uniref:PRELI domain containing 1b n=1 Tax=Hypomesus transpacificus TaxID=137520 RepID=UPI001F080204|nr:PRELI domain containing 1b [Hypomesus transpacificus]XP_046873526.1 PRELI domain containing 1b [Hypomesus transpacificus]